MSRDYPLHKKEIEEIKTILDADAAAYLNHSAPLKEADLAFMGRVIQSYCYADFNARRIIDTLRHAALGAHSQNAGSLQDAQVFPKLREAAEMLPEGNLREGIIRAANNIEMHIQHRHHFAHWAARRVIGHDVLVMLSNNAREGEKRLGTKSEPGFMTYALVPLAPWRTELPTLEAHGKYLAEVAVDIEDKLPALIEYFDGKRAAARKAKYEAGKHKRGAKGPPTN